ncbi:MAG TPA: hypothetical protein VGI85_01430 [Chthoniobacterales bacterium]|jgi:hypothetical protein
MQATLPPRRIKVRSAKSAATSSPPAATAGPAAEEIYAFIAARDLLLADAEEATTEGSLHRLWMANEFAERCLEPARLPYAGQTLPAAEAAWERQRCKTVKVRIAELRTRVRRHAA